jgi:hypothetical protein
METISPD